MVISLLVLLVATLMSIAGISTSQLQERIAANQKQTVAAQMAAESGASIFVGWLSEDVANRWCTNDWQADYPSTLDPNSIDERGQIGDQGFFWVENTDPDPADPDFDRDVDCGPGTYWEILISGHVRDSSGGVLSTQRISYKIGRPPGVVELPVHKAFGGGLLAENDIQINGNVNFIGGAHSNGDITITGGNNSVTGILSAVWDVNVSVDNPEDHLKPNADYFEIPRVTSEFLTEMAVLAGEVGNQYYGEGESCDLDLSGDLGGMLIYCASDVTVNSSSAFSNVTLVTTGSMTYNGSSSLGENYKVTVAMIAKDNITFNGKSTSHGVFWLNGKYVHNGKGTVEGAIVSAGAGNEVEVEADVEDDVDETGTIIRNGVFEFIGNGDIANPHLPRDETGGAGFEVLLSEWKQVY